MERRALDGPAMGLMVLLCLTWGLQQVMLKAAANDVSPLFQIALRSAIAAALVGLLMAHRGESPALWRGPWRPGLIVGVLFGLEFLLLGESLRLTTASHAVVLLYTAPIFVALGLHSRFPAERLAPPQWIGVTLAFAGIALTFLGRADPAADGRAPSLLGDLLALLAGLAWAATTVGIRVSRLADAPATLTLLYQLVVGAAMLLFACLALGQTGFRPTPLALGGLAFQALIVSFASYLAWFWLLKRYLAAPLGVFSFLTPLFGIAFGVWWLDEALKARFIAGALLVLAGIVLVNAYRWWAQRIAR